MTQAEAWTVTRLLQWTKDYLEQQGSDSARLDAEVLLAHASNSTRIELYARFQEEVDEPTRAAFRELVKQRAGGAPVAYLVGNREFYSLRFRVTRDVLIPRPETETLVLEAIELSKTTADAQVADIGVGSGIISVCLAKFANCRVAAVDISEKAIEVARVNAESHQVAEKITFHHGDLLEPIPAEQRFHLIASNPPYVSQSEYESLSTTVRDFEPQLALLSGPKGDELFRRLAESAFERLLSGGWLLVEVSPMIAHQCVAYANELGYGEVSMVNDLNGLARVLKAQKP